MTPDSIPSEGTSGNDEPAVSESDAENAALDDEAVRLLGNAKTVFWDVPVENLNQREQDRLSTLKKKTGELEEIVRDRKRNEATDDAE